MHGLQPHALPQVHVAAALLWLSAFVAVQLHGLQLQMAHAQDWVLELVMTHLGEFSVGDTTAGVSGAERAVLRAGQSS
jgi:hypothetical protein